MLKKIFIVIFFINYCNFQLSSQIDETTRKFHVKVKQFAEFIDRFNYEKDFLNNPVSEEFQQRFSRDQYLKLLFNEKDKRLADSIYQSEIDSFIYYVTANEQYIDMYSDKIFAELKCNFFYKNESIEIELLLQYEFDNGLKWSVNSCSVTDISVDSVLLQQYLKENVQNTSDDSILVFIPPYSNETNFIVLNTLLKPEIDLMKLTAQNSNDQYLIPFYYLISKGQLNFMYITNISYYIYSIENWIIKVDNYNRISYNSGWLISDLIHTKDTPVFRYLDNKYGLEINTADDQ